jgi:hypothetical protein
MHSAQRDRHLARAESGGDLPRRLDAHDPGKLAVRCRIRRDVDRGATEGLADLAHRQLPDSRLDVVQHRRQAIVISVG